MATSEEIFREAVALPHEERADLTDRLVASLVEDIPPEITSAQLAEVRRRIAQVESGEVELVPGDEVLAKVRRLLVEHTPSS
jgi:putative addiction module component (TIGR02574 family)